MPTPLSIGGCGHETNIGCVCARVILIVTSKRWHVWSWIEYLRWQNCCTTILATLLRASKGWTIAEFIVAVCVLAKWKWNSSRIILYANVIISIQCAWWNTTLYCRNASCSTQQMPTLLIPWGWTTADITGNKRSYNLINISVGASQERFHHA